MTLWTWNPENADCAFKLRLLLPCQCCRSRLPVNMPDRIPKRSVYGQLWPLRPACSQNRPGSYIPDQTSRIHFSSVFPKNGWIILNKITQNRLGSDLDGLVRVWPNTSFLEASWFAGIIWPSFWQDATGPLPVSPLSDSVLFFHRCPG